MSFSFYSVFPFLASLVMVFLSVFVFLKKRKSHVNQGLSFFAFVSFIWLSQYAISYSTSSEGMALLWLKIGYIGVILFPPAFSLFIYAFLKVTHYKKIIYFYFALSSIFIYLLWATNYFINGTHKYFWGYYPKAGPLHPFFLTFFVATVSICLILLFTSWIKAKKKKSLHTHRILYLFLGYTIYVIGAVDFVPNYGIEIYPFGWIFAIFFVSIITYAILKYQLMDIRVVIKRAFFYSIGIALVSGTIVGISFLGSWFTRNIPGFQFWIVPAVAGFFAFMVGNIFWQKSKEVEKAYEIEKQAHEELRRLSKAKDEFTLVTQHHLRTPLSIVKGHLSNILESDKTLSDSTRDSLNKTINSTNRLTNLVDELIDITQMEVGKEVFDINPVDIKEVINSIAIELDTEIKKKKLDIEITPQNSWPQIPADLAKIKIALFNLIDNSIKYTEQGKVTIKGEKKGNYFQISIKDTGIGMDSESTKDIFSKYFERGNKAQKLYATGRGIGLFIAANIVKAHNGKIYAKSEGINKGSEFVVELKIN